MKRRHFVVGTASILPGLSGCSGLSSESQMLNLVLFNQTEVYYAVQVRLFRDTDDSTRSEARAFSDLLHVDPGGQTEREDIAEAEPYVIDYSVYEENSKLTDQRHFHYYPTDGEEGQTFDIRSPGVLTRR